MRKPARLGGKPLFSEWLPITRPTLPSFDELASPLRETVEKGLLSNVGINVRKLEEEIEINLEVENAIAVSSCTLGLILALKCLGLKGEVIVPSFTFSATVHSLIWNNLTPVFADCDPETYNMDVEQVESLITPQTSAILAVYIFGNPPDIEGLEKIAFQRGLRLVFDSAHGLGSLYKGKPPGSFGDVESFSMTPTKLVVAGEGGMVTTSDDELAERVRMGRNYGDPGNYDCEFVGLNARMPEWNAILALKSLEMLEENASRRNELVKMYKDRLSKVPGISFQKIGKGCRSSFKDFSLYIDANKFGLNRDELAVALKKERIQTRKYFYPPIHWQRAYKEYYDSYRGKLPVTERVSQNLLSIPLYSHMPEEEVEKVCVAIENIHDFARNIKNTLE